MRVTINGQDYSGCLDTLRPLSIVRKLNEPSTCRLWISIPANAELTEPACGNAIAVEGDDGTLYFTGFIAASPLPEYAGQGMEGSRYRIAIEALSDEMLMDQAAAAPSKGTAGMTAGALMSALAQHTGTAVVSMQGSALDVPVSWFAAAPGATWSQSAGQVASQARAAYRALGGVLSLTQIPATVHALREGDGSLDLGALALTAGTRMAGAQDVTVCGEDEPTAYVTEFFEGDGATSVFELGDTPYAGSSAKTVVLRELFNQPGIDATVWANSGAGYFSLGAGGLAMTGGDGVDGDTMLTWIDPVEMGGTLLLEASGLTLATGSAGVLAGLFTGLKTIAGCVAGFQASAQPGTGTVMVQPVVMGTATGAVFTLNPANQYTLRTRIHCCEQERSRAVYQTYGDSGAASFGGDSISAPGRLHFEIQEFVNGVAGMPVVLYDGSVVSLPGACSVVAASSLNLKGSLRAMSLTNLGSGWVVSTPHNGAAVTRRLGTVAEGGECAVERTGRLTFYSGFVPAAGEQIAVNYRAQRRAVGRAVGTGSQSGTGISTWIGSVTKPPARSSADCRNAAAALLAAASSGVGLWNGSYKGTNFGFASDVWPGDALLLDAPSAGLNAQVVVRTVEVTYQASCPDLVGYSIHFANDWAEALAIKTSTTVPADTWLPAQVVPGLAASLNGLTATSLSGSAVAIDAGVSAPSGGGFEVRRRDYGFMAGEDRTW